MPVEEPDRDGFIGERDGRGFALADAGGDRKMQGATEASTDQPWLSLDAEGWNNGASPVMPQGLVAPDEPAPARFGVGGSVAAAFTPPARRVPRNEPVEVPVQPLPEVQNPSSADLAGDAGATPARNEPIAADLADPQDVSKADQAGRVENEPIGASAGMQVAMASRNEPIQSPSEVQAGVTPRNEPTEGVAPPMRQASPLDPGETNPPDKQEGAASERAPVALAPAVVAMAGAATPQSPVVHSSGTGADPAPESDTEYTPTTTIRDEFVFRNGKLEARSGRKVKFRHPRLSLGGQIDVYALGGSSITLAIRTDSAGKVLSVQVSKGSKSEAVDKSYRVAAYDWWFEPPTDPAGNPVAADYVITIHFL